jgi:ubiquinone/menaquinone biosynthesis C-methylase UbiE
MHTTNNEPKTASGPETAGLTLHRAGLYDVFSRLIGLGVNQANSRMVVEMAKIKPGDKILDVGCGTGNLTLTAKRYAGPTGSVTGIDASPEMIGKARANSTRTGIEAVFEIGLVEKIPFPAASFDVVMNRLMIHHLPDDLKRQAFVEIFRVLKPGGLLFVADFRAPDNFVLAHLSLIFFGHRMMQNDVGALPPMLKDAGFTEVASGPTHSAMLAFISGRKPTAR